MKGIMPEFLLDQQFDLQFEIMDPLPQENVDMVYDAIQKTIIE